ncbi:hypothetical protein [Methylomonas sp. AM2-LC]
MFDDDAVDNVWLQYQDVAEQNSPHDTWNATNEDNHQNSPTNQ